MNFFIDKGEGALLSSDTLDGERFRLSLERIRLMTRESAVHPLYVPYFQAAAEWILLLLSHGRMLEDGSFESLPIDELQRKNRGLMKIFCRTAMTAAGPIRSMLFLSLAKRPDRFWPPWLLNCDA